jgi:RNA polymerase-binding transcription factor DksA
MENSRMDAIRIRNARRRLTSEHTSLRKSLERSQHAAEEIKLEKTEDEGDLASISHDKDVLYRLHEGGFARLQLIQKAIEAIENGHYGECIRCEGVINEKRLEAIPWASMCIACQEQTEVADASLAMSLNGLEAEAEL